MSKESFQAGLTLLKELYALETLSKDAGIYYGEDVLET